MQRVGDVVGHSSAGAAAIGLVALWLLVGLWRAFPSWWQTGLYGITSAVTFIMVFVIQHTQSRQIAATQHKLDELIEAHYKSFETDGDSALSESPRRILT